MRFFEPGESFLRLKELIDCDFSTKRVREICSRASFFERTIKEQWFFTAMQ